MLNSARRECGLSMIEVMVTLALAGILMAFAAPTFSNWMQNSRIRITAEAVLAGLQYAQSEATARNSQVRFQLTSSVDNDCAILANGTSWVVDMVDANAAADSVASLCATPPSDTVAPRILQTRSAREGSGNTVVQATAAAMVFNGLGRLTPVPQNPIVIAIGTANNNQCTSQGGELTCLQVVVSPAGQMRMCNPALAPGNPQAC